jgi:hypothetical protein
MAPQLSACRGRRDGFLRPIRHALFGHQVNCRQFSFPIFMDEVSPVEFGLLASRMRDPEVWPNDECVFALSNDGCRSSELRAPVLRSSNGIGTVRINVVIADWTGVRQPGSVCCHAGLKRELLPIARGAGGYCHGFCKCCIPLSDCFASYLSLPRDRAF